MNGHFFVKGAVVSGGYRVCVIQVAVSSGTHSACGFTLSLFHHYNGFSLNTTEIAIIISLICYKRKIDSAAARRHGFCVHLCYISPVLDLGLEHAILLDLRIRMNMT